MQQLSHVEKSTAQVVDRGFWGSIEDTASFFAKRSGSNVAEAVGQVHRARALVAANPRTSVREKRICPTIPAYSAPGCAHTIPPIHTYHPFLHSLNLYLPSYLLPFTSYPRAMPI